jgi:LysR family nitrogen assimilation transcriptional regulator
MPVWHDWPMDLKRLRTFVVVAEHGSISAATQVLNITQPALSRQITGLEQELGHKLFDRAGRHLLLTSFGEQIIGDCRSLLAQVSALTERAQSLRRGDLTVLKIAGSALTIEGIFPAFLRRWDDQASGVRLAMIEADADKQLDMLERGEAHLAINVVNVVPVDNARFASYLLPLFHVVAAYSPSLPIAELDTIEIQDLARYPLLLPSSHYATRSIFDAACGVAGVRPDVMVESGAAHALLALAEAGHGVAIIPSILLPNAQRLRTLRVTHRREDLHIELAVLWDRRRGLSHQAVAFSNLLSEHVREMFPSGQRSEPVTIGDRRTRRGRRIRRTDER